GVSFIYLYRTLSSMFSRRILSMKGFDAICATSHYLPDVFMLYMFSILSAGKAYFVHLYHVFPLPMQGSYYEPLSVSLSNWIQQIIGFKFLRNVLIFTFESQVKALHNYGFDSNKIRTIGMGLNLNEIESSVPL